MQKPIQATER